MIRVTTQNIDFTLKQSAWKGIVDDLKKSSDVILFQEAKWTNLHAFADEEWGVFQDRTNDATAGTAVMWRKSLGRVVKRDLMLYVPSRKGVKMGTRYVAYIDLRLANDGRTIRFASMHYPPQRFKFLWDEAGKATREFVKLARKEVGAFVIGSDFNQTVTSDVHGFRKTLALRVRGIRIDGFLIARRLIATRPVDLGNNRSDHNPVTIRVRFKKKLTAR